MSGRFALFLHQSGQEYLNYPIIKIALLSERQNTLSTTPMVITIDGDKLTVAVGAKSRTVQGIYEFRGSLTTQSVSGKIKSYIFVNK
jgi:hypothetical protein